MECGPGKRVLHFQAGALRPREKLELVAYPQLTGGHVFLGMVSGDIISLEIS